MPFPTQIIANPISGKGKGERATQKLISALKAEGFAPRVYYTARAGEARLLVRKATRDDTIICVGGDGTINEIINGLLDETPARSNPLAILPMGAGNVIAKELKLSRDIKQFVRLLKTRKTVKLDVGIISFPHAPTPINRKFISMTGCGFDAEVTRQYHLGRQSSSVIHPHLGSYLPISVKILAGYKMPRISVKVDGQSQTSEASFVQVANARSYGGPFRFIPQARPDDGWLDILWYLGQSRLSILKYYWRAFLGDGTNCRDARLIRGRKVALTSDDRVAVQLDGDCCGYLPAEISIIPQAVSFLVDSKYVIKQ